MTQQPQRDPAPAHAERDRRDAQALAVDAARALRDAKCEDVLVLDVREISQVTSFLVIATGTSDRQMRSACDDAEEAADALGHKVFGRTSDPAASWIVLDFVDVVVHVFEPNTRAYYDLETLWGGAPEIEWKRPATPGSP